jgi:hypothetical protein
MPRQMKLVAATIETALINNPSKLQSAKTADFWKMKKTPQKLKAAAETASRTRSSDLFMPAAPIF